jgi:hypothetical protein
MNRRDFLKLLGLAAYGLGFGFGTTGCASFPKDVNWASVPDSEFTLEKFDDWFKYHKLFNDVNPNLGLNKTGIGGTFRNSITQGWSPGIAYNSSPMIAVADGIVVSVHNMDTGRLGGTAVSLGHPEGGMNTMGLESRYVHLNTTYIKGGQEVLRGQPIGTADPGYAKLMVTILGNLVDPDNYGEGHTYMKYFDGVNNPPVENPKVKIRKQRQICEELFQYAPKAGLSLRKFGRDPHFSEINHPKRGTRYAHWDYVEMIRYMDELYKARPDYFPRLSPDKFAEFKKEFYANQPIILTLPLKA